MAECAAWAAYYRHEWLNFLRSALAMVAAGFGMGQRGAGSREELVEALDALYSHVYGMPTGTMAAAAGCGPRRWTTRIPGCRPAGIRVIRCWPGSGVRWWPRSARCGDAVTASR